MGKKKSAVELIAMQCGTCKSKNYSTEKNRRNLQGKLELSKFCRFCRKHTGHREAKIK